MLTLSLFSLLQFIPRFTKLFRLALIYFSPILIHARVNRQDIPILKENCLLIKGRPIARCRPGVGGRCEEEFVVAAICVLMGSHKGSGAATLRGDKRILRSAFSGVVAINGKTGREGRMREGTVPRCSR